MRHFYQNNLIIFLILILPTSVIARSNKDADAVVTMRNGNPCFSYPQISEMRKRSYAFVSLGVSSHIGAGGWGIHAASYDRKGIIEPNTTETCIEYGIPNPGIKVTHPAEPLQLEAPYRVHIFLSEAPTYGSQTSYDLDIESYFCITRNGKGKSIIVAAEWGDKGLHCLKPSESPKVANKGHENYEETR